MRVTTATYSERLTTSIYLERGEAILAGLALYDLERLNVAAGRSWAEALIHADDVAAHLAADYANAGFEILPLRLHPRERIEWLEAQWNACVRLGDRRGEGNALCNLGIAWAELGETRRAIDLYDQHLAIAREIGDRRGEGNVLGNLGIAWSDLGESRRAIDLHNQRLAIAREIGDRMGEGNALGNLGGARCAWRPEPRHAANA